jgi:hypothetical protein
MFSELFMFLLAVVSHWQSYVTGGVLTAILVFVERLSNWKMPKWAFVTMFGGVFLLVSFFLSWRDQERLAQQVPGLQAQIQDQSKQILDLKTNPPHIEVNLPTPVVKVPPGEAYMSAEGSGVVLPSYKIGGNLAVSSGCKNLSPSAIAESASCVIGLRVVNTKMNPSNQPMVDPATEEKEYLQFKKDVSSIDIARKSYGPNESDFKSVFSPIVDEELDRHFRSGSKTILVLGEYGWRDGVGEHTNEYCVWLQNYPGLFSGPGAISANATITWHSCKNHNGLRR